METFLRAAQIALGGLVLGAFLIAFAYLTKQPWRFKAVGYTSFLGVLTAGLFALTVTPLTRPKIQGAKPYQVIFDRGRNRVVISVAPQIQPKELEATLQQARAQLVSSGRSSGGAALANFEIVARTLVSVEPGVSQVITLGRLEIPLTSSVNETGKVKLESFNVLKTALAKQPIK